jgi:steroid 5-alpha reductase family enzyme
MQTFTLLFFNLVDLIIYMSCWFVMARRLERLDVVDTAWGGGFVVVATLDLMVRPNDRTLLVWLMVTVWGLRLSTHIWRRNSRRAPDGRYLELSARWPADRLWLNAYVRVFLLQAALVFLVSLPIAVVANQATRSWDWLSWVAVGLWLSGFIFESVADRQLRQFMGNKANKGKLMTVGLWRYSRHPNYFGELVQWWAIGLLALGPARGWLAFIGPAVLTYLIVFVSGLPPIERRHAKRAGYQEYKRRTSALIPLPPHS